MFNSTRPKTVAGFRRSVASVARQRDEDANG